MRLSRPVAWLLVGLTVLTAGLLRQYHSEIPRSPFVPPLVGSLLFAAVFFLLLVAAREWRGSDTPGTGVRLGTILPLLLMLLVEKWVSLGLYNPIFYAAAPAGASEAELDAMYRAFAGLGLLLVCLLVAGFSPPAAMRTWKRARPYGWAKGAAAAAAAVGAAYGVLFAASWALGGTFRLERPAAGSLLAWIVGGQALRATAEEVYYRGLLLAEMERLAPRLGFRGPVSRRWAALLPVSLLFGMEHMALGPPWSEPMRQMVFIFALGLLLGILVLITESLPFAAGMHAWVNWLVLGAAPRFVDEAGGPSLPAATYVGLALAFAFVIAFVAERRRRRRAAGAPSDRVA